MTKNLRKILRQLAIAVPLLALGFYFVPILTSIFIVVENPKAVVAVPDFVSQPSTSNKSLNVAKEIHKEPKVRVFLSMILGFLKSPSFRLSNLLKTINTKTSLKFVNNMQKSKHKTINHTREYAHGDVHTNTVESAFSLLKRGIVGTWHKVSAKHLPAYLDEMCFRFNNRKNRFLFRDTLIKLILSPNLEYKHLTATVQDVA